MNILFLDRLFMCICQLLIESIPDFGSLWSASFVRYIHTFIIQALVLVLLTLDWLLMKQSNKKHYSPTGIIIAQFDELGQWRLTQGKKNY